jgi:hypothetical protein
MGARAGITGRWALPAPTGFGKSASIAAYVAALLESGKAAERPLLICQETVDALGEMASDITLLAPGEADRVGIFHTVGGDVPTVAREDVADYPVLMVPHARLLSGRDLVNFMEHQGCRRLVIFDESFMRTEGIGLRAEAIRFGVAGLLAILPPTMALAAFLKKVSERLEEGLARANQTQTTAYLDLPDITAKAIKAGLEEARARIARGDDPISHEMVRFLEVMPGRTIRVLPGDNDGRASVLQYRAQVHEDIADVLVFDGSYPLRQLCHLDPTLRDATADEPDAPFGRLKPLNELKRWERVRFHHVGRGGGKSAVRADHLKAQEKGEVCWRSRHLADVITSHPDERILIVTHKRDERKRFDHQTALRQDLTMLGVDLTEKLEQPDRSKLERFVWMTWRRALARRISSVAPISTMPVGRPSTCIRRSSQSRSRSIAMSPPVSSSASSKTRLPCPRCGAQGRC